MQGWTIFPSSHDTCTILTLYSYIGLQVYTYVDLSQTHHILIFCGTATDHQSSGLGRLSQCSRFIPSAKNTTNKYRPDLTNIIKIHNLFIQILIRAFIIYLDIYIYLHILYIYVYMCIYIYNIYICKFENNTT